MSLSGEVCSVTGSDIKGAAFHQLLDRLQLSEEGEYHCLGFGWLVAQVLRKRHFD